MAMLISGNIVECKVIEGISEKTGREYRMVSAKILTDFGTNENPRKDLLDVQMDSEFPYDAITKFVNQINKDTYQKVELRVRSLTARQYGNSAQNSIAVEFLSPRIEIPAKEKAAQTAQTEIKTPTSPGEKEGK